MIEAVNMYIQYENNLITAEELVEWCKRNNITPFDIVVYISMQALMKD